MGIIWKFTMVLLSTLAALVIIVNSAEEEYEAQYRKELRPRTLDTGMSRAYEQPWRIMDIEAIQTPAPEETWADNSSEEPIRRRKLGRKRKRQPEPAPSAEILSHERQGYNEEPRPNIELGSAEYKIVETPKRRRKKIDVRPDRWHQPATEDRPIRRRGLRRKRPTPESWPEFSEFGDNRPSGQVDTVKSNDDVHNVKIDPHFKESEYNEQVVGEERERKPSKSDYPNPDKINDHEDIYSITNSRHDIDQNIPAMIEDSKSVSDITIEDISSIQNNNNIMSKYSRKGQKAKETGAVEPITLKDILKRSNGTSLSEILQQHNLSLTDLLHDKDKVLSILKPKESAVLPVPTASTYLAASTVIGNLDQRVTRNEESLLNYVSKNVSSNDLIIEIPELITTTEFENNVTIAEEEKTTTELPRVENTSKKPNMRRFPTSIRRKQRIRPIFNNTLKSQLSRDMIALNARKYFNNRRRNASHEWRDLIPVRKKNIAINLELDKNNVVETTTPTTETEETTIFQENEEENCTKLETELENLPDIPDKANINESQNQTEGGKDIDELQSAIYNNDKPTIEKDVDELQSAIYKNDKPVIKNTTPEPMNKSGLRRQAFNNRLHKKRLRQKNLTTEPPPDDILMNLFGMPNLVSSSEFISQTQSPKTIIDDDSLLEDFLTTRAPRKHENKTKTSRYSPSPLATTSQFVIIPNSTEKSAKIEIEEILNDTHTSAKLSKILKERNMTLHELVEHRERGSSHVHLADIFHNASKEPNAPEPFLSKSSVEPISKETYPLRALLDANIHDTTAKATTIDSVPALTTDVNLPAIMDYGKNGNENAENMGIMSLFHNITKHDINKPKLKKDSQGAFYETSITVVNATDPEINVKNESDTAREGRVIHILDDNQDDIVSWNDIFTLMRKNYENSSQDYTESSMNVLIPTETINKGMDEDLDSLLVLEDLQRLKDFDTKFGSVSKENIEINTYEEKAENSKKSLLDKIPSQTKSVTIAAASIAGLSMILFLLTFVGYKWHQHRMLVRKKSFSDEHVPSPVFENRKGHKNNSSSRSISPMLSTSNIYTVNTLDSRNGKESPDYMWDSLRKPFQ